MFVQKALASTQLPLLLLIKGTEEQRPACIFQLRSPNPKKLIQVEAHIAQKQDECVKTPLLHM